MVLEIENIFRMYPMLLTRPFYNEFTFTFSRSSGPGGQNVNRVSTKVELRFDIMATQLLDENEKQLILEKLKNKINSNGELIIVSQSERTQAKNRERAIEKFYELIQNVLKPVKKRVPSKPTRGAVEKRLDQKRKLSEKKQDRKPPLA